jgi:hypothetical protein
VPGAVGMINHAFVEPGGGSDDHGIGKQDSTDNSVLLWQRESAPSLADKNALNASLWLYDNGPASPLD